MQFEQRQQETLGNCCLTTLLAFGVALTILTVALAVRFL